MGDKYLDEAAGGADNGGSGNDAWQSWTSAVAGAIAGDDVWVRRTTNDIQGGILSTAGTGTAAAPIRYIGWPKPAIPNTTITEGDFTNGSRVVDNVVGITPSRTQHTPRYITAPDGEQYMLTAILWEADVDGMAGAAEFTNGSALTNTTQTKLGRIWSFTDNLDTTGTLQYVRDSATAWIEDDNLTDADGGDAEIDAGGEVAVGFLIDREYAGSTVTGTDGKFQIEADGDYDDRPAVAKVAYDADAIDLPLVDFNDGNFYFLVNAKFYTVVKNIEFKDSTTTNGMLYFNASRGYEIIGCLFKQTTQNDRSAHIRQSSTGFIRGVIFEGSGAGANQVGLYTESSLDGVVKDAAFYNFGDSGLVMVTGGGIELDNVNIGVEIANGDDDIAAGVGSSGKVTGKDVSLGGTNGYVICNPGRCSIENYQKVLGDHKTWFLGGEYISTAVSGETPNKKLSDIVMKITPNVANYEFPEQEWDVKIPLGEINADAGSQNFLLHLYNDTGVILNDGDATADIYLQADYVKSHDDSSEYTIATATSTEHTIADAADADDWDSLSVTINPAVESKVRLYLRISKYETDDIFIDPQVVIT